MILKNHPNYPLFAARTHEGDIEFKAETWGNRSIAKLRPPADIPPAEYAARLASVVTTSYPSFVAEGGMVVEENYFSIGD